ncbi:endonuclease NucS [Candidatus Bathyarchaeota archaeon]|nr:endonuclease NucS [Candidatus Bathyarchaeota archaeon]
MPVKRAFLIYESPSLNEALSKIEEAFIEQRTVLIVGRCWVEYRGRASSKLKPGERIVIVKEDGSLLVHRCRGYEPVNWQPPGCFFKTYMNGNFLTVKAIRRSPRETVIIYFDQIYLLSTFKLIDEGEFSIYASEEDMQKAILLNPSIIEDGFTPIEYEKKVEPGFVDVYGVDKEGRMVVIEIKRRTAGKDAVLQLARYIESIKNSVSREVRGILVAPKISRDAWDLLNSLGLSFKRIDPKKCSEMLRKVEDKKILDFLLANEEV